MDGRMMRMKGLKWYDWLLFVALFLFLLWVAKPASGQLITNLPAVSSPDGTELFAIYRADCDGTGSSPDVTTCKMDITDVLTPALLNSVDSPSDAECLAYDLGTLKFEWVSCGSGAGDSITVNSSAATDPDFADGDIDWTLSGGNSITATVACTGCVDETDLKSMTSAELAGTISNETGTGLLVYATDPTFTTGINLAPTTGLEFDFTGGTDFVTNFRTDGGFVFDLDFNNDSSSTFVVRGDAAGVTALSLDEAGTLSVLAGLDAVGAVDMDYGSADVTDHTFTTDGTGTAEFVVPAGSIDSTEILDSTVAAADMADADHGDVAWSSSVASVENVQCGSSCISDAEVDNDLTLAGATIGTSTITMTQGTAPTPTAEGVCEWETDDDHILCGDAVDQVEFVPTEDFSGDATVSTAGVVTVADDSHAHVITNIDAFTVAELQTQTSDVTTFYTEDTVVPVADGGTGASSLTDGGILLGSGTGAITALGAATNGQIPIGDGTTDPVLATITGTANEITVTNGAGSITLDIPTSPTLDGTNFTGIPSSAITTEVRSMYWPAGSMNADGTQCADPAEVTINSGPIQYTVICTDNDASSLYGHTTMPDSWDGGTVTFELVYLQTAADTSALNSDVTAQCHAATETVNSTWGTEIAIDDAAVTGSNAVDHTTSAAVTPAGTCAAGDSLWWRWQLDATGTTTAVATLHILGMKMEYTSNVGD